MKLRHIVIAVAMSTPIAASAVQPGELLELAANREVPANVTLLAFDGKEGRSTPIFGGYRPSVRFSGSATDVTCSIKIDAPKESVKPGESADVRISCNDPIRVQNKNYMFTVFEGGRRVGSGALKLPAKEK